MLEIQVRADYKAKLLRRAVKLLAVLLISFGESPVIPGLQSGLPGYSLLVTPLAQTWSDYLPPQGSAEPCRR